MINSSQMRSLTSNTFDYLESPKTGFIFLIFVMLFVFGLIFVFLLDKKRIFREELGLKKRGNN